MMVFWYLFSFSLGVHAQLINNIPVKAFNHKATIAAELDEIFPEFKDRSYVPALIEHESCIRLTHKRCWSSTSQLKSQRELGVGLGQITKAYNADGSLRFDSLNDLRNRYRLLLQEASWDTIYQRPDLQIRMIVLMLRDNWNRLHMVKNDDARRDMMDVSYNGGSGNLQKERRVCGMMKDCDPNIWFKNVERYCQRSRKILYGDRSACDISRDHPRDVIFNRLPKYRKHYQL